MSDEWKETTLGHLGRVVTGKTPLTAVKGNFGGHIPFVTPSDMDGRKSISSTARFLTHAGAASVKGSVIPAGSVMVSCIGSDMGKVVIAGRDCVTNQQINSIVVDDRFSSEFVYYSLSTRKSEIRHQAAGGSAVPILNKSDFSCLEITLPPLSEQRRIAHILGTLDDKIELNRRMNATLEAMARALYQSWFVNFDPVRRNVEGESPRPEDSLFPDSFEDSAIGAIPTEWEHKRWGDLETLEYGKSLRDYRESTGKYRVFGTNGPIGFNDRPLCESAGIVIGRKGAYRRIHFSPEPFFVIDTAFYLKPKTDLNLKWAYYELLQFDINGMDSGSAIPSTSRNDFYGIPVVLPPSEIQEAFGKIVDGWFAKIHANEAESRTLTAMRDTLLPKLLTGEIVAGKLNNEVFDHV